MINRLFSGCSPNHRQPSNQGTSGFFMLEEIGIFFTIWIALILYHWQEDHE